MHDQVHHINSMVILAHSTTTRTTCRDLLRIPVPCLVSLRKFQSQCSAPTSHSRIQLHRTNFLSWMRLVPAESFLLIQIICQIICHISYCFSLLRNNEYIRVYSSTNRQKAGGEIQRFPILSRRVTYVIVLTYPLPAATCIETLWNRCPTEH